MHKHVQWLWTVLFILIFLSVGALFYRSFVLQDFAIVEEAEEEIGDDVPVEE